MQNSEDYKNDPATIKTVHPSQNPPLQTNSDFIGNIFTYIFIYFNKRVRFVPSKPTMIKTFYIRIKDQLMN